MTEITLIIAICACIFGILGLILSVLALIKAHSLEKSTHTVQWVQPGAGASVNDSDIEKLNKEIKEQTEEYII